MALGFYFFRNSRFSNLKIWLSKNQNNPPLMIKISNQIGLISLPSLIKIVPLITPFGKKNSHPLCHLSSQASPRLEKNHVEKFNKINKTLIFYKLNIILTIKKRGSQNQWGYGAIECAISISGWTQLEWFQLISLVFLYSKKCNKNDNKKIQWSQIWFIGFCVQGEVHRNDCCLEWSGLVVHRVQ